MPTINEDGFAEKMPGALKCSNCRESGKAVFEILPRPFSVLLKYNVISILWELLKFWYVFVSTPNLFYANLSHWVGATLK